MLISITIITRGLISDELPLGIATDGLVQDGIVVISLKLKPRQTQLNIEAIMKTIEIKRTGHRLQSLEIGESVSYNIDMSEYLRTDAIQDHSFVVLDENNDPVTDDFGRGSRVVDDLCTIGINAHAIGTYQIVLWFTCIQYLPDNITNRKFTIEIGLTVR